MTSVVLPEDLVDELRSTLACDMDAPESERTARHKIATLIARLDAATRLVTTDGALEEMTAHTREAVINQVTAYVRDTVIEQARGLDTDKRVRFYEHDFYPLSNFSAFSIEWGGLFFPTSEHLYHWEKFRGDAGIQNDIRLAPSAHEAFKHAEVCKPHRRPDWDAVKVDVMREILRAKVSQHEYVRRKLLATGDRELVEDSWRDDFWGWGPERNGKNMLGKLWMEIRAELRAGAR